MTATQARRAIAAFVSSFLAAVALARPAAAAEPDSPVLAGLTVTGPADCASRTEVAKQVARRSARIHFVDGAAAGPALRVTVEAAAPGAIAASLSIAWPDGSRSDRHLTVPTCAETADAIALVIVLALDPSAASRERAPAPPVAPPRERPPAHAAPPPERSATPPAEKPAPPTPQEPPAPADDRPAAPAAPPGPDAPVVQAKVAAPPPAEVAAPSPPPVYRFDVGAAARLASGPAPALMPGVGLTAGWERDTGSLFSWKLQLGAAHYGGGGSATFDGTSAFTLDLLMLDVCPIRVAGWRARARLCGAAAAGRIRAEGMDALSPRTLSRPFVTVGGAISLAVSPHPRVEVTASVEPQAALIRDRFSFGANVFHDVPAVALFFGLGAALTFQ